MAKRNLLFEKRPTTHYPDEELIGFDKTRTLIGKAFRLDLIASKEGQFMGFEQERLFVPEETMNHPPTVKRLLGEACYRLLLNVKSKHESNTKLKVKFKDDQSK